MPDATREELEDLPPSAKLVLKVLEYQGSLTQKEIIQESMLSARTVRYALERLEDIGVVDQDIYFADARQNLYEVIEVPAPEAEADGGTASGASSDAQSDGGRPGEARGTSSEPGSDGEACCVE